MKNTLIISDCIEWQGGKDRDGYGVERYEGNQGRAHRNAYRRSFGEIPKGMLVCHSCDNPSCVNPNHLFLGTPKDNMQDKVNKGRQHRPKGELNGQSVLTEDNVRAIKLLLKEGEHTQKAIGTMFGCSRGAVLQIHLGINWRHIE